MSHNFNCSMEISCMHQHFETWYDIKHEQRKLWTVETTIFLNLCKNNPTH